MELKNSSKRTFFPFSSLVGAGLGLLALTGCQPGFESEEAGALGQAEQRMRIANGLSTQALVLNAISTNPQANGLLSQNGLVSLFHPAATSANATYIHQQLWDTDAQQFMEYLVGCALDSSQSLAWKDPSTQTVHQWTGRLGLCSQWETQAPSLECMTRVSACLLARNNPSGVTVNLSVRGENAADASMFWVDATEAADFTVREGAFYGNIFEPAALAARVYVDRTNVVQGKGQKVRGAVYQKMFACHAPEWTAGLAYSLHRVCALPGMTTGTNCAAAVTGACMDWDGPASAASKCGVEDGPVVPGDMDFEKCQDTAGVTWTEPLTVFLQKPCDVVRTSELCARKGRAY
jgi:hypothetical protein